MHCKRLCECAVMLPLLTSCGAPSTVDPSPAPAAPAEERGIPTFAAEGNSHIYVVDRMTLEVLDSFGGNGEQPGDFQARHHIASDSHGNLYTAEAQRGQRAQKFTCTGMAPAGP